jgi:hypothetical protein
VPEARGPDSGGVRRNLGISTVAGRSQSPAPRHSPPLPGRAPGPESGPGRRRSGSDGHGLSAARAETQMDAALAGTGHYAPLPSGSGHYTKKNHSTKRGPAYTTGTTVAL